MQIAYQQTFPDNKPLIAGKPTHFVEKIVKHYMKAEMFGANHLPFDFDFRACAKALPKVHQILTDKENVFRPNSPIIHIIKGAHSAIAQFAPRAKVVSTQTIEISHLDDGDRYIWIDGSVLLNQRQMEMLAINEGFYSLADFFAYYNEDFKGKLVHWTDLKY